MAHLLEIQASIDAARNTYLANPTEVNKLKMEETIGEWDKYYSENATDILGDL